MQTRSLHTELTVEEMDAVLVVERGDADRKSYSRGRSVRMPKRRSTRATGNAVPLGMAARRNRRWAW